jgi:hypothetical protein
MSWCPVSAAEKAVTASAVKSIDGIREDLAKLIQVLTTVTDLLGKTNAGLERIAVSLREPSKKK